MYETVLDTILTQCGNKISVNKPFYDSLKKYCSKKNLVARMFNFGKVIK